MAKEYSQRPSSILGVDDEWAAYQLDLAAMALARRVEDGLAHHKSIGEILGGSASTSSASASSAFADPRGMQPIRKIKIPESGIW